MSSEPLSVAGWLAAHPAPIHKSEVSTWSDQVRSELGDAALEDLADLLALGDLEQQYQAVAAVRALGAEVWAEGYEPDLKWTVTFSGAGSTNEIRPTEQLAV